jgi:tyrosyl-tRNA synthetase
MTMPILVGVDGHQKMSKSLGNQIGVTDTPQEMYGKTLSIPDEAMEDYYRLLLHQEPPGEEISPRDAKRALARELVGWLHSPEQALEAEVHFDRVFVDHQAPEHVDEAFVQVGDAGIMHLPEIMAREFGMSRSEARRLIEQGAVSLDDAMLGPQEHDVAAERADGALLKVGKRRFRRLRTG